ncbi:MAG: energy-coupling factor ABC transporter ATP-binding protein [Desulfotalea sp.]
MNIIELKNIDYSYGEKPILHDINIVFGNEKIGLVGPNGSGKTTLFHLLVGLLKPSKGQLIFHGKEIENKNDLIMLRRSVGFLFQSSDDQLFSPTVLEDVSFGPLNLGKSPSEAKEISMATLHKLGLHGFEDRITHRLSGGEKKLVSLATILSMEPEVLLLDEPTNNLDPATRERLIQILCDLPQTQVIISHDLEFLDKTTSKLYSIKDGKIDICPQGAIHEHKHIHAGGDHHHHH